MKDFEASPRCRKLEVRHYMLKPIQRIPQYKLLLQDYLKTLPEGHHDKLDTERALEIVSRVADHLNEELKLNENFTKLLELQNSISSSSRDIEIIKPHRILIKRGELDKLSRHGPQPRIFILFNDSLMYLTQSQTGLKINHEMPLLGMSVSLPPSCDTAYQNEFRVVSTTRSVTLVAK